MNDTSKDPSEYMQIKIAYTVEVEGKSLSRVFGIKGFHESFGPHSPMWKIGFEIIRVDAHEPLSKLKSTQDKEI